jgi:hypothetical protein
MKYSETLEFNAYQIEIETKSIESKRTESNRNEINRIETNRIESNRKLGKISLCLKY